MDIDKLINNLKNIKEELDTNGELDMDILHIAKFWSKDIGNAIDILERNDGDDWILCSERMPNKKECDKPLWITYGSANNFSTEIAYCEWVYEDDEFGNDISHSEFYIKQSPWSYSPSSNLVTAWKPIRVSEPYKE